MPPTVSAGAALPEGTPLPALLLLRLAFKRHRNSTALQAAQLTHPIAKKAACDALV